MVFPDGTPSAHALIYILIYELQRDETEKKGKIKQPTQTFSEYLNVQ